jgi:hypothetical protein
MDSMNGSRPPQPPAATAEAETAALQAQVVEVEKTDKDIVVESSNPNHGGTSTSEKTPENGMKNYFVRTLLPVPRSFANVEHLARLLVRNQAGPCSHHTMLYQLHWFGCRCAPDERSLRYGKERADQVGC